MTWLEAESGAGLEPAVHLRGISLPELDGVPGQDGDAEIRAAVSGMLSPRQPSLHCGHTAACAARGDLPQDRHHAEGQLLLLAQALPPVPRPLASQLLHLMFTIYLINLKRQSYREKDTHSLSSICCFMSQDGHSG